MPMIIKNNVRYCSTGGDAENIVYDNAESGMEATNMQDAIDELNSNFGTLRTLLDGGIATSESGQNTFSVPESSSFNGIINFTKPFNTIPSVLVSYIENVGLVRGTISVTEITKGGFSFNISNTGEHTVSVTVSWNATADVT